MARDQIPPDTGNPGGTYTPSAPPGVGQTTTGEPGPIGVNKGYKYPGYVGRPSERQFTPDPRGLDPYKDPNRTTYYDGDEYIPANWGADQIWQLQQAMAKIGLLTGSFTRNTWDSNTRNAYRELLGLANAQGVDANRALTGLLQEAGGQDEANRYSVDEFGNVIASGGAAVRAPLITRTTDPAALRSTFRKAVIEMLGEGWSQEEINKMVAAYNGVEIQRQTQAYNMDLTGGNVTDIPTPE